MRVCLMHMMMGGHHDNCGDRQDALNPDAFPRRLATLKAASAYQRQQIEQDQHSHACFFQTSLSH
jgi:hypothetical protein